MVFGTDDRKKFLLDRKLGLVHREEMCVPSNTEVSVSGLVGCTGCLVFIQKMG